MQFLKLCLARVKALFMRNSVEQEMNKEMQLHIDELAGEYRRLGMSSEDAVRAARRQFGNLDYIKETARDIRGAGFLDTFLRDLRYAVRTLRSSPAFTGVIVLSLALGIGANTALFSVFDALFLREIAVRNPHELVAFGWTSGPSPGAFIPARIGFVESRGRGPNGQRAIRTVSATQFSPYVLKRMREGNETLTGLAAFSAINTDATIDGQSREISALLVSGNYFQTVGIVSAAGRLIDVADDQPSASAVVVISDEFWKRQLGSDPSAIGKRISVGSTLPATIVGVTPPGFQVGWGTSPDFTIPVAFMPQLAGDLDQPDTWILGIVGRTKTGVTLDAVRQNLQGVFRAAALESNPATDAQGAPQLQVISGSKGFAFDQVLAAIGLVGSSRRFSLLLVVGTVFFALLLIVCLNVANLLVARSESRRYEVAVRLAMGAGRLRLIQQLLTESLVLALIGGALATVLAYWGKDLLRIFLQRDSPFVLDLRIDTRLLGFSLAVSVLTGILFGLLPAFRATRMDVNSAVKQNGRNSSSSRTGIGKALVVTQVALSLVLLIGAGLLLRTLGNLPSADIGFNAQNLLVLRINPSSLNGDRDRYEAMIDTVRSLPAVSQVTASFESFIGTNGNFTNGVFQPVAKDSHEVQTGTIRLFGVRNDFFETTGIPLLRGRLFESGDTRESRRVAVITESLARQFGSDPIGWRFGGDGRPEVEIVGVVKNVGVSEIRGTGMMSEIHGTLFLPEAQIDGQGPPSFPNILTVRSLASPVTLIPSIRAALREIEPTLRAFDITTQTQLIERKLAPTRRIAVAWTLFGGLALVLTCIGLYGLLSYSVARRTNEIGIRLALGARRVHVLRMVVGQIFWLVIAGIILGLGAAMAVTQTIRALIYGVAFYDPFVMGAAIAIMLIIVALASYLPAYRASRVDPTTALKYE